MTLGCLRSERFGDLQSFIMSGLVKICRVFEGFSFPPLQHLLVTQCYTKLHNVNVDRLQLRPQVLQGATALLGDPEHSRAVLKATLLLLNLQLLPAAMLCRQTTSCDNTFVIWAFRLLRGQAL